MKKSLLIGGGLLIVIAAIIAAILLSNKKPVAVTPEPQSEQSVEMCYLYDKKMPSGFSDRALLKMSLSGKGGAQVTGEYKNLPAESDSKVGTFNGTAEPMDPTISARTADVWWNSMAEGMTVTEQLKIVFGEGSAVAQFGEMVEQSDGTYIYKDPAHLTNGFQMSQVDCEYLNDMTTVEDYLKKNIATIAPKKSALGGTWYVITTTVNPASHTGSVTYEDGHIQETSSFSYTRTNNEVIIVWK
jgi:hypothetical protein